MVMALHFEAALFHGHNHFTAQVLVMIHRRHREVAFFVARAVSEIVGLTSRIPTAFFRVNEIKTVLLALIEANVIEDKERSEEHTSELQSLAYLVCRLLLEKKN